MARRALFAVAGFFSLCLPLFAQQADRIDTFSTLNRSVLRHPSLTLSDERLFSFSGAVVPPLFFNWIGFTTLPDLLPELSATRLRSASARQAERRGYSKDSSKEVVEVRPNLFDYASGEVGFLYGRSTGKYGRDYMQGYIFGEVGDDKFHISVGASYEESNGRVPRLRR
jgi:hypothetical protein